MSNKPTWNQIVAEIRDRKRTTIAVAELARLRRANAALVEACKRYERAHIINAARGHGHSTDEECNAWLAVRAALKLAESEGEVG